MCNTFVVLVELKQMRKENAELNKKAARNLQDMKAEIIRNLNSDKETEIIPLVFPLNSQALERIDGALEMGDEEMTEWFVSGE